MSACLAPFPQCTPHGHYLVRRDGRLRPRLPATFSQPHSAFDSLVSGAAKSTDVVTVVTAESAGVFSAATLSVLDDLMRLALALGLLLAAASRPGAVRRRQRRPFRRSSAVAGAWRLGRATRVSGSFGAAAWLAYCSHRLRGRSEFK